MVTSLTDQSSQPPGGMEVVQDTAADLNATVYQGTHDDLNANANLQVGDADVSATNPVPIDDVWTVALEADETLNDSDKTITVTAGQLWQVLNIRVEFTSTATAGDRQLVIQWRDDSDDVVGEIRAGTTQDVSLTYYYEFAPALADLLVVRDSDWLMTPIPPTLFLPAGYDLRIYDNNAVDAAADDMVIQMMYAYKTV